MELNIAGIDPALANFGLSKAVYDVKTKVIRPTDIRLITTEKTQTKTIRVNADDFRRATEHSEAVHEWVHNCHVVFAEIPTGSQSARGSFSNGISTGIVSAIGSVKGEGSFQGQVIQLQPTEVKMAAVGSKYASKEEMIEWATGLYPYLPWLKGKGEPYGKRNEHCADAIAVLHAGVKTGDFKNLLSAIALIPKFKS
jgi:Holliday junction resolvasome RuvABC endonuclease subunit